MNDTWKTNHESQVLRLHVLCKVRHKPKSMDMKQFDMN